MALSSPIFQTAFVVDDIGRAVERWSREYGVGPFFAAQHVSYAQVIYRGQATNLDVSLAFAFSGDMQIELVQQHNGSPSIYREFSPHGGYNHSAVLSLDIVADTKWLLSQGHELVQSSTASNGSQVACFAGGPTGLIELIKDSADVRTRFEKMRRAAQAWDGVQLYAK